MGGGESGPCNNKGIMSYGSYDFDQWSTCSRSDWEHHYTSLKWGDTCLEDISGNVSPTVAPGPNVCFDVKTVTKSYGHELEWTIGGSSHPSCNNERKYDDNQEYTQTCCLPSQAEFAITCKDSYGDGWNGGYLEINGNQYCKSSGQWDEFRDTLPNPSPETPEEVCTSIKTVTKSYAEEISWTFGKCESSQKYTNNDIFSQECCQEAGSYDLVCKDSYGDGWNGGYIEIGGTEYCREFQGKETTVEAKLDPKLMNTGKDCWSYCNGQQGPCSWCGSEGMCCTQKSGYPASNGCDGSFGGQTMHECALKPDKICLPIFMFQLHITCSLYHNKMVILMPILLQHKM